MLKPKFMNKKEYSNLNWTKSDISTAISNEEAYREAKKKEIMNLQERKRMKELHNIRNSVKLPKKTISTTKIFMYFILFNCLVIEVYSMWVMYKLHDLSALYALIGAVIGESISFAVYCAKSFKETKEEEDSKLRRDKFEASLNKPINNTVEDVVETVVEAIAE